MKTLSLRTMTIGSIAIALFLIISAFSFASDDRYSRARTIKSVFAAAFSPSLDEEVEFYVRPNFKASSSSTKVSSIDALVVINYINQRNSEGTCTTTSEVELKILPGLNTINFQAGSDLTISSTSGDDVIIPLSDECPKDRLFVEIGLKNSAPYKRNLLEPIAFSILNKEGRTLAFSGVMPGRYTITELPPD
jgi:hypothetical protein